MSFVVEFHDPCIRVVTLPVVGKFPRPPLPPIPLQPYSFHCHVISGPYVCAY